jgi:hypothetical protein
MVGDRAAPNLSQNPERLEDQHSLREAARTVDATARREAFSLPGRRLEPPARRASFADFWTIRHTLARSFIGQHQDNEAVMEYLSKKATDIEWIVHRAGIGSDGPSKGVLKRSVTKFSVATHLDCSTYNYRTISDASAVHTSDLSYYAGG